MHHMHHLAAPPPVLRLLIPICGRKRRYWAATYAMKLLQAGRKVEACLLHVLEPNGLLQAIWHPGSEQPAIQRQRAETILALGAKALQQAGIPYAAYLRSGPVVTSIIDAAEELDCREIVIPRERRRFFSRNISFLLESRQRGVPVVWVDAAGLPVKAG